MQDSFKRENLDFYGAVIFGFIGIVFALWWNHSHPQLTIRYDCSIAEINPDYPVQVKEECRKLNAKKY